MAGPTRRALLKFDELRAMALPRSARSSIIRTTNAWRVGISTALTTPWKSARPMIHGIVMWSLRVRAAIASDCAIASTCTTMSTLCRSHRSTHTPASGGRMSEGAWLANATTPSRNSESVRR